MDASPRQNALMASPPVPNVLKLNHFFFRLIPQCATGRTNALMTEQSQKKALQVKPKATGVFSPRL